MLHNLKVCGFIFSLFFVLVWIFHRTMPSPAPNITLRENGRERREGERERVLFTLWADLRFTVIQLHRGDNSCLYLKDSFSVLLSFANLGFTHSHDFDAQVNLPQRTPIRTQKRRKEKCPVHTLLLLVFPFLISRSGAGRQSHVQEEDSERQRQLQEPQGISEQREDGERFDRSCCSVLRAGLSQQTVHQQQRRVLWHRLQGEHKLSVGYSSYRDFTWEVKRISISQF